MELPLVHYMSRKTCDDYDLVAQLDRVTDYESVGLGFESLPGHHNEKTHTYCVSLFYNFCKKNVKRCLTTISFSGILNKSHGGIAQLVRALR